jgi:antirestriction protein ArdC
VKAEAPTATTAQRIEAAETFFAATGATVRHGGNRAYFAPALDLIQLPPFETFRDAESYTATKAHEFVHWTGHDKRLARELTGKFGCEKYAQEELCAELGSAFLCADLAITPEPRPDHASYIAGWLKALKDDKRLIFKAAAQAQKAADHLHSYTTQPKAEATADGAPTPAATPLTGEQKQAAYAAQRAARRDAFMAAQEAGGQGARGRQAAPIGPTL